MSDDAWIALLVILSIAYAIEPNSATLIAGCITLGMTLRKLAT
jgi:hypothetical protein